MSERNPIYQSLVRTKLIRNMMRDWKADPGNQSLGDQFHNEMDAIRSLSERGVITYDEKYDLSRKAARFYHAQAIKHYRSQTRFRLRRELPAMVREAESYSVRF